MIATMSTDTDERPVLLMVDDDETFCRVMGRAFEKRGFEVHVARSAAEGQARAAELFPEYALVDLRMPGDSGLVLVKWLKENVGGICTVVLTGYASIATAVEAIKLGAAHYLTKPVEVDELLAAFAASEGDAAVPVPGKPMSVNRVEWEHIQRVLLECEGNVSETARRLGMHRRTLQRKLAKKPAPESPDIGHRTSANGNS
jgi:two-component system response regulator RegA